MALNTLKCNHLTSLRFKGLMLNDKTKNYKSLAKTLHSIVQLTTTKSLVKGICFVTSSPWLWASAGLKMPIHGHFFRRTILTRKVSQLT